MAADGSYQNPSNKDCWTYCTSCSRCADKGRYTHCNKCSGRFDPKGKIEVHPEDCPRLLVGGQRGPDVRDVMNALHSAAGKRLRCLKIEKLPGKKEWRCDDILPESDLGLSVAQTFGSPLG